MEKRKQQLGIENKIILGDFNCTIDKMDKYGGKKEKKTL